MEHKTCLGDNLFLATNLTGIYWPLSQEVETIPLQLTKTESRLSINIPELKQLEFIVEPNADESTAKINAHDSTNTWIVSIKACEFGYAGELNISKRTAKG